MKTKVDKVDFDFKDAKNKCRITVGKTPTDVEPKRIFNLLLLISEHSPIRLLTINWTWEGIKSWVATHWSRHKWECFISTQRTDRTGVNRDELKQSELVNFSGSANMQNIIDTSRKRLCRLASEETRELMEDLKQTIMNESLEAGLVLVPNCIYRCGCPELTPCGMFEDFRAKTFALDDDYTNIVKRYELYQLYLTER